MLVHMFLYPRPKIFTITTAMECLVAWFNGSPTVGLYFNYISGLNNWTLHCALCLPLRTMLHQTVVIRMLQASFRLEGGVHRLAGEPEKVILCRCHRGRRSFASVRTYYHINCNQIPITACIYIEVNA